MPWSHKQPDLKNNPLYLEPRVGAVESSVAQKATKQELANIGNGSPKGTYATLVALQTAFPTGTTGIYLVTADGKWYYWNGSAWTAGGQYQSTGIADNSITATQLAFPAVVGITSENMFNKDTVVSNKYLNGTDGLLFDIAGYFVSDYIPIEANTSYYLSGQTSSRRMVFYKADKSFISTLDQGEAFTTPALTAYIRYADKVAALDVAQIEKGLVATGYVKYGVRINTESIKEDSIKGNVLKKDSLDIERIKGSQRTKNLFDKSTVENDKFLLSTGVSSSGYPGYFVSDYIPLTPATDYYLSGNTEYRRISFYKADKSFISILDQSGVFTTPALTAYIRYADRIATLDTAQIEKGSTKTSYESYGFKVKHLRIDYSDINNNPNKKIPNRIYSINDAWTAWMNGEKFPIAFYGDSTFDGVNTTGNIANTLGADDTSPNAFPKKLEEKLRAETGNNVLRIYNAGFSGRNANWGNSNIDAEFTGTAAYSDVKMIGIGFGINDRLNYANEKLYRVGFKTEIIKMIDWCYNHSIQPFLLTTQAIVSPGVEEQYVSQYPLRTAQQIETVANEVKRELAKEYALEIIEMNEYTERFLTYSSYSAQSIIFDKIHFGDVGHIYEAELLFSHLNPYTMIVTKKKQIDYTTQSIVKGVPENLVTMPASPADSFKVVANYTKADSVDTLIFKAHVFIDSFSKMTLKSYKSDVSSLTYIKVNGVTTTLDTLEKVIGNLDLGLHTLEVWTGASTKVDFKGFILE